ncbi:MAG: ATP-binding protein [Ignavibacteriae bacterium]|nr:ATP-binding protein [Ignavibacteriota bacterium]MCB9243330.1 ATP-binding protein [Ignavibacteriales bacterium]
MGGNNQIKIPSSTKNLATIRKFVEDKALEMGFDPTLTNQIVLSVDEACTNIIKYTHKFNESESIELKIDTNGKQIKITINYHGDSFDPNNANEPDMEKYFEKFQVGGLGIPLMRKFMNDIVYIHKKPDYNSLILTKVLP